jgi:hypothetical protein
MHTHLYCCHECTPGQQDNPPPPVGSCPGQQNSREGGGELKTPVQQNSPPRPGDTTSQQDKPTSPWRLPDTHHVGSAAGGFGGFGLSDDRYSLTLTLLLS